MTTNVDYLRSGGQFIPTVKIPAGTSRSDSPQRRGRNARLVSFEQQMLAAYVNAMPADISQPPTVVNTSFLRSGREFEAPTAASPEAQQFSGDRPVLRGRHTRLEEFSARMLDALNTKHRESTPESEVERKSEPKPEPERHLEARKTAMLNISFLRSGAEFLPATNSTKDARRYLSGSNTSVRGCGRDQRAKKFHNKMLNAFVQPATPTPTPTVVNISFLRSGSELLPATNTTASAKRFATRPDFTIRGKGRNQRAKDFANKMLIAYQTAKQEIDEADKPITPVINTAFLRSSKQFEPATANLSEAQRFKASAVLKGRNTRLEKFADMMLLAHAGDGIDANPVKPAVTPEMARRRKFTDQNMMTVNLDYLRTGAEFHQPVSSSSQARRFDNFETQGRYTRLERFHDRMLAAGRDSRMHRSTSRCS